MDVTASRVAPVRHAAAAGALKKGDAAAAFDEDVREVLFRGNVPRHLALPIIEGVFRANDELVKLSPRDRQVRLESTASKLREMWDEEFQTRKERIDALVVDMREASDALGALFDQRPWLIHGSLEAMTYLDRVASHRAAKEARR